jgi:hypothetical protein
MAGPLNATVILAKCSKTKKLFGIRAEQRGNSWIRTWAFPIDEEKAKHEGFHKNKVNLGGADEGYPGCPFCRDTGFVKCGCEKIGCMGGMMKNGENSGKSMYTCPWCGSTGEVQMKDVIDVSGGGY